ncbi:MAG: T9SS type A sorting domain-containing protein [Bacteroidota bacterium]
MGSAANTETFRDEYYSVWISTTGTAPEDFTMVFEETLPTDVPNWQYQPREIDISDYAGEDIHVTFRHHNISDKDRLVLFDVKIYQVTLDEKVTETVLFEEDFTSGIDHEDGSGWLPEGWQAVDADEDGNNWYFDQFEEDGYMLSRSWDDGTVLFPDNWLITPVVSLPANSKMNENGYMVEDFEFIPMNIMSGGEEDDSHFKIVPNPDQSDANPAPYVVQFHRSMHGVPWGGFWSTLPETVDLTENKYVYVKVWKPRLSPVKFKVEGGPGGTFELESMEPQTLVEEWETMVFHFPEADGEYPIIAFMPDFEDPLTLEEDIVIYFGEISVGSAPTSIDDVAGGHTGTFTLFPNPANESVSVSAEAGSVVGLYDITGSMIQQEVNVQDRVTFDVSGLAKGIYLVRVVNKGVTVSQKLMVY